MKKKYISPIIGVIECYEETSLLLGSKPEVKITDTPTDYWTMGAKDGGGEKSLVDYIPWGSNSTDEYDYDEGF